MAPELRIEVGNAIILLNGEADPLSEGHTTGYLEFYDERHRLAFPLTSHAVCDHLVGVMGDVSMPVEWRAGRIAGWMEALIENAPETFVSIPRDVGMTVFSRV